MAHSIRTVYVVHHSHTDIGYTDLQERVIDTQAQYIGAVLSLMKQPGYADFRWNCETWFCVENVTSILENLAVIDGKPKDTLIKQVEILWVTVTDKFKRKVDGTER